MPFEFQPYESRLTGTIADLIAAPGRIRAQALRAVGEARARAAEASGQRSAQLAQNLGQIASGTIGSILEDRRQAPVREMQALELQGARDEASARQGAQATRSAAADAIAQIKGGNAEAVLGQLSPEARTLAEDWLAKAAKGRQDRLDSLNRQRKDSAKLLQALGYDMTIAETVIGLSDDDPELPAVWASVKGDPAKLKALVDHYATLGEKPEGGFTLSEGQQRFGPDGKPVASVPAPVKPEPGPKPVYRIGADKRTLEQVGEIPANATMVQEPQPPRVTVNAGLGEEPQIAPDPASANILSQTGLSINAFRYLTGQAGQLPRDRVTRQQAAREASEWSRKHNVDISTMAAQYKTQNDVLAANIARLNNTKIMEQEILGTGQNLQTVVNDKDLGRLNVVNVARIWAGQEVNDNLAQQYAMHLSQLRNELTAYFAATQGRTGNNLTLEDKREAEGVIKNGLAKGSLAGLMTAIENSTGKMGAVMQGSVDRAQRAIWDLFGVGKNYKGGKGTSSNAPTHRFNPATGKVEVVK